MGTVIIPTLHMKKMEAQVKYLLEFMWILSGRKRIQTSGAGLAPETEFLNIIQYC